MCIILLDWEVLAHVRPEPLLFAFHFSRQSTFWWLHFFCRSLLDKDIIIYGYNRECYLYPSIHSIIPCFCFQNCVEYNVWICTCCWHMCCVLCIQHSADHLANSTHHMVLLHCNYCQGWSLSRKGRLNQFSLFWCFLIMFINTSDINKYRYFFIHWVMGQICLMIPNYLNTIIRHQMCCES